MSIFSDSLHWVIAGPLARALFALIKQFFLPGRRLAGELARARQRLEEIKGQGAVIDIDQITQQVMITPELAHCWAEDRDSLHRQKAVTATGTLGVSRWRATSMANLFFTEQTRSNHRPQGASRFPPTPRSHARAWNLCWVAWAVPSLWC